MRIRAREASLLRFFSSLSLILFRIFMHFIAYTLFPYNLFFHFLHFSLFSIITTLFHQRMLHRITLIITNYLHTRIDTEFLAPLMNCQSVSKLPPDGNHILCQFLSNLLVQLFLGWTDVRVQRLANVHSLECLFPALITPFMEESFRWPFYGDVWMGFLWQPLWPKLKKVRILIEVF